MTVSSTTAQLLADLAEHLEDAADEDLAALAVAFVSARRSTTMGPALIRVFNALAQTVGSIKRDRDRELANFERDLLGDRVAGSWTKPESWTEPDTTMESDPGTPP